MKSHSGISTYERPRGNLSGDLRQYLHERRVTVSAAAIALVSCLVAQPTSGDSEKSRIDFFEK